MSISHDSINRFLLREKYTPFDLFNEIKGQVTLKSGVISVDDMVIDKPYSELTKSQLIGYFYSGKHHKVVKGINIITLFYTDINGTRLPVNFRIINPEDSVTKNELFREMLAEVLAYGMEPAWVTGDCWYSSLDNLKFIRKRGLSMLFGIQHNRVISEEKGAYASISKIENWIDDSAEVYLKGFGMIKVFRQMGKNTYRYYLIALPDIALLKQYHKEDFKRIHKTHWNIESFHRATKQLCNIEQFQVRTSLAIANHIFCAIISFVKLEMATCTHCLQNWYQLKKGLFIDTIKKFISDENADSYKTGLMHFVNA